jgi:uncharacterized protein
MRLFLPVMWQAALVLMLICGGASAQGAGVVVTPEIGVATRILVIGDALAGGLGAGLSRMTETAPQFDVTFRFNESSGLARPEIYDWAGALPNLLDGQGYQIVVVMIGGNDRRDILGSGQPSVYGSVEWTKAYRANVDRLIDVAKAGGVEIYWAGQPPMGDADYDAAMVAISKIQKEEVAAKGGTFVDFYAPLTGPDGKYTDMGNDDTGTVRKLRSRDGVTFYKQGNNRLAQIVLGAITAVQADKKVEPPDGAAATALPSLPIFGEPGENGTDIFYDASKLAEAFKNGQTVDEPVKTDMPAAKPSIAQTGSAADRFFATGLGDAAPAGRFDDFGVAVPAQ